MKFAATVLWYAMEVEPNGSGAAILSDLMAMMTPVADMKHAEPQPRRVYADVQQKNEAVRSARGVVTGACHQGSTPASPASPATSGLHVPPLRLSKMVLRAYSSKILEAIQWHPSQSGKNVCSYHLHFMHATSEQHAREAAHCMVVVQSPLPPACHRRTICIRLGGEVGDSHPSVLPCSEAGHHPRSVEPRLLPSERQRMIRALRLLPPRLTECRPMFSWPFSPLI